jgi:hypothetical protein
MQKDKQYIIPNTFLDKIKSSVINKFQLKNSFQLNDKLDGILFLNNQYKRILPVYIFQKENQLNLINDQEILKTSNIIVHNNLRTLLLGVDDSSRISIPDIDVDMYLIFQLFDRYRYIKFIGSISKIECVSLAKSINQFDPINRNTICFINKSELL